jgi:hypothetical protein
LTLWFHESICKKKNVEWAYSIEYAADSTYLNTPTDSKWGTTSLCPDTRVDMLGIPPFTYYQPTSPGHLTLCSIVTTHKSL